MSLSVQEGVDVLELFCLWRLDSLQSLLLHEFLLKGKSLDELCSVLLFNFLLHEDSVCNVRVGLHHFFHGCDRLHALLLSRENIKVHTVFVVLNFLLVLEKSPVRRAFDDCHDLSYVCFFN